MEKAGIGFTFIDGHSFGMFIDKIDSVAIPESRLSNLTLYSNQPKEVLAVLSHLFKLNSLVTWVKFHFVLTIFS